MAYSYQTFTSGQVLTGAQMQQVEDNIRDHKHGLAGVGVVGIGFSVSSKGAAFSVAAADHGTLFLAAGDFDITMAAAGTLGATFGCGVKNIGSGRIAIRPNGSQLIDASSYYVLTPGEMTNLYSDGIGLGTFGNSYGPKLLWDTGPITSLAAIDITRLYQTDFARYEVIAQDMVVTANGQIRVKVSQDSGSTFIAAGYVDETTADTTFHRWSAGSVGSLQFVFGRLNFANEGFGSSPVICKYDDAEATGGASSFVRANKWPVSSLNAIRITPGSDSGNFSAGRVTMWGYPRR